MIFKCNSPVMLRTCHLNSLDALKNLILSNMGAVGSKEVGKVAYRFLSALLNGGFRNRTFWVEADQHVMIMFDIHARLMLQHVMEWYAAWFIIFDPACTSSNTNTDSLLLNLATVLHADTGSSNESQSSDEFVLETSSSSGARVFLPPLLAIPWLSEVPSHYYIFNLDAMQLDDHFNLMKGRITTRMAAFKSKDVVLMAVKNYSIRRNPKYKVLESDRLKYHYRCKQFSAGCPWSLHIIF
ncbi:hypothetical protein Ahy_B10g103953 [Arachis hypogaea]|uniref:Transposase MuDR plant domain-containing protein n=1 Tax=Arachis hypogaea TaxID=3818 RepID=A0A444X4E7_ARAHY|nr:hypothetical protein Ahy_B10g103953 [Arachis hypogaea]